MKIQADKEGISVINQLCDIALKSLGLQAMRQIGNYFRKAENT